MRNPLQPLFKHFSKSRPCPVCGKQIERMTQTCECGYCAPAIYCPRCMNVVHNGTMAEREACLSGQADYTIAGACSCGIPYQETEFSSLEYIDTMSSIAVDIEGEEDVSTEMGIMIDRLAQGQLNRAIYESVEDKSAFDFTDELFQLRYAFMFPYSEIGKQYFAEVYGKDVDTLLKELHLHRTETFRPKCPICGSPNLTRISAFGTAAKIAALGLMGAGDIGKTWKCNSCGAKF